MPHPNVIELRQYTLHAGARERLVTLFEREFIETQEAVGLQVLGIFEDADAPERFVWLRGFAGMAERRAGLEAFYGGPVWQRHRDEANATMIDSDDVLLLRPLTPWPPAGESRGGWHALAVPLREAPDEALRERLRAEPGFWMETEPSPNDFPRLPVRDGWWVLGLATEPLHWPQELSSSLLQAPRPLRLRPTRRSPLR